MSENIVKVCASKCLAKCKLELIPLHSYFLFHVFYSFLFLTKILNVFKYNQKRWFHNLQLNVIIHSYKIRNQKNYVSNLSFSESRILFSIYYIMYMICTQKLLKLSSNIGLKMMLIINFS
jgi:hypothetical protein